MPTPGTVVLSHTPDEASMHVYLNGVEQYRPLDWDLVVAAGVTSVVPTAAMDVRSGDLVECRYACSSTPAVDTIRSPYSFITPGPAGSAVDPPTQAGGCANPFAGLLWGTPPPGWTPTFAGDTTSFDMGWTHTGSPAMPRTLMQDYDYDSGTGCLVSGLGASSGTGVETFSLHYAVPSGKRFGGILWGQDNSGVVTIWALMGFAG